MLFVIDLPELGGRKRLENTGRKCSRCANSKATERINWGALQVWCLTAARGWWKLALKSAEVQKAVHGMPGWRREFTT